MPKSTPKATKKEAETKAPKRKSGLRKMYIRQKESFLRFHNHAVIVRVDVPLDGARLFFNTCTLSSKRKEVKLRYDSLEKVWKLWAPRSFVSNTTTKKMEYGTYRWEILQDDIAAKAMEQKKKFARVIRLEMNYHQLTEKVSKHVIL